MKQTKLNALLAIATMLVFPNTVIMALFVDGGKLSLMVATYAGVVASLLLLVAMWWQRWKK